MTLTTGMEGRWSCRYLRGEMVRRGLPQGGHRGALVDRLLQVLREEEEGQVEGRATEEGMKPSESKQTEYHQEGPGEVDNGVMRSA